MAPNANRRVLSILALSAAVLSGILAIAARPFWHAEPTATGVLSGDDRRIVFTGEDLSDVEKICFTCAIAAGDHPAVPLLHSAAIRGEVSRFIDSYRPDQVVHVGHHSSTPCAQGAALDWEGPFPERLWQALGLRTERLVVCRAEPRRLLLQAACLAGVVRAPLCILNGRPEESTELQKLLVAPDVKEVFAVGEAQKDCATCLSSRLTRLPSEESVVHFYLRRQSKRGAIRNLVLANPADVRDPSRAMSGLAPWIALQKHAALLLTNDTGKNVRDLVNDAIKRPELKEIDSIIYVADLKAIPAERRANPAPGKDAAIDMDPLTPADYEPFTFATGRLFHAIPEQVVLLLARQTLLNCDDVSSSQGPRKALVVSNPAGGLPLLETFSRNTASELRNAGYETTAIFGNDVAAEDVRRLLPQTDIFLWEGHHSTMTRNYGLPDWPEPLRPSLVFLQSCLALCEEDSLPLLRRGAVAIVGTSSRTYSASGGACSLAFFDSLLYENQTLGSSLRHAKNFLLAYALLKEKRLGEDAKLSGANLRSAWAFSLWGDPTLKLPRPNNTKEGLLSVRHEAHGNRIELHQPDQPYELVVSERFQSQMLPNARLGGLVQKKGELSQRQLIPLLFAEVHLPKAPAGATPRLYSRIPAEHWVFNWDSRRKCGYLLVTPRAKDAGDLRFQVHWDRE
jgi:hypothetical protein